MAQRFANFGAIPPGYPRGECPRMIRIIRRNIGKVLPLTVFVVLLILAWIYRTPLLALLSSPEDARIWIRELGVWGPLALIALNAIQIIVAQLPSYVVQGVAGYIFGLWPGIIFSTIGNISGGAIATSIARLYGRPLVKRVVGVDRLERWEHLTHAGSMLTWAIVMLLPLGDVPYYIIGLAPIPLWKVLLIALLVRQWWTILMVGIGAGVLSLGPSVVFALALGGVLMAVLSSLSEKRLESWVEGKVLKRLKATSKSISSGATTTNSEERF